MIKNCDYSDICLNEVKYYVTSASRFSGKTKSFYVCKPHYDKYIKWSETAHTTSIVKRLLKNDAEI